MKNWSKGDRVSQPTYGAGTLVEVNEHHTVIDFDEGGRKVFATRLVVLQASNEPAPHKTPTRKRAVKKKKAADAEQSGPGASVLLWALRDARTLATLEPVLGSNVESSPSTLTPERPPAGFSPIRIAARAADRRASRAARAGNTPAAPPRRAPRPRSPTRRRRRSRRRAATTPAAAARTTPPAR